MWRDGRGLRQELIGPRPAGEPVAWEPPAGAGTRVTYHLDRDYFAPGARISADIDAHGPYCTYPPGPGTLTVHDRRGPGSGRV